MGLFLNGLSGAYASTPDHADLDITGDIDIRCAVAMNDWTPSAESTLVAKSDNTVANQRSYELRFRTDGKLFVVWSPDGTGASTLTQVSTNAFSPLAGRSFLWVRVTADVDDGAGNRVITFYSSVDGNNWTVSSTHTTAGATSFHSGTATLQVGALTATQQPVEGRILAVVIKNGIDGTTVFSADFTKQSPGTRSFTEQTGKVVTINGSAFVDRYETGGTLRSLRLPGSSGNYASTPDAAALDIVGDIDMRVAVAMDDWTPAASSALISKYTATGDQRSYLLQVTTGGNLRTFWTADGVTALNMASTVAPTVSDGAILLVRCTLDVDDGAGNRVAKFYTKTATAATAFSGLADDTGWTQLGTTVTTAGTTSIFSSTAVLEVGTEAVGTTNVLAGRVLAAELRDGIDGSVVFRANFNRPIGETSFTEDTGKVVTLNGNARYTYEAA